MARKGRPVEMLKLLVTLLFFIHLSPWEVQVNPSMVLVE
jgi:hypothetical protein